MKRLMTILCCTTILCCLFTGCTALPSEHSVSTHEDNKPVSTTADTATFAFNREDTLDPFSAKTALNVQLSALLYDNLVTPDAAFAVKSRIASVKQTDPTHITATVKNNIRFSDGTRLSAADIIYSFELARHSAVYKARLEIVQSAVQNGETVVFTLKTANKFAAANLSFPVIKANTDTKQAAVAAIGSGPYRYQKDDATLVPNTRRADAKVAAVRTIHLRHTVNMAEELQSLENGSIQYMYNDLSSGSIPRTSAKTTPVALPHLLYLGVNSKHRLLNHNTYRQAISAALDRTAVAAAAYTGRAQAATSPFHPDWKFASGLSCMSASSDTQKALAFIKKSSRTTKATKTTASDTAPTTTTTAATSAKTGNKTTRANQALTLIYPRGNSCRDAAVKMIVSQLSAVNIKVTATPLAYKSYLKRLQAGKYDLYLGEIRLTPSMDLSVFLQKGGTAAYGINSAALQKKYTAFLSGDISAAGFVVSFGDEMPYIPVCWLQGMVAHDASLPILSPTAYDLFKGLI